MQHPIIHTETLPNGFSFDMIYVEGGTFMMGDDNGEWDDEKPAHEVTVSSFWLGKYPVTQALWKAVMGEDNNPSFFQGDLRPVEMVNWYDAVAFCNQLSTLCGYAPCYEFVSAKRDNTRNTEYVDALIDHQANGYRLPMEAEWEYAGKGGKPGQLDGSAQMLYAGSDAIKETVWYVMNSHSETKEIGQKWPNSLGLYEMNGNVYEWCYDWLKGYPDSQDVTDRTGTGKVARGSTWQAHVAYLRTVRRNYYNPGTPENRLGFRLARNA